MDTMNQGIYNQDYNGNIIQTTQTSHAHPDNQ